MALTHRIVDLAGTAGLTYNFLASDLLRPLMDTWSTTDNDDGTVTEYFRAKSIATDANIITDYKKFKTIIVQVKNYWGGQFEYNSVWYERYSAAESQKRSLIRGLKIREIPEGKYTDQLGYNAAFFEVWITHDDFWEAASATTNIVNDENKLINTRDITDPIDTQSGDLPGRLQVTISNTGAPTALANIWMGIKPLRYGVSDLKSWWECEGGALGTDAALAADTTASPGVVGNTKVKVDFGTVATMAKRLSVSASQAAAGYDDLVGSYNLLLRSYVDASTSCLVQAKAGLTSNTVNPPVKEVVRVTNTGWKFIELGQVTIPPLPYRSPSYSLLIPTNFTIELWAERIVGTGTQAIYFDAIVLIPAEHYCSVKGAYMSSNGAEKCMVLTNDDGSQVAINYTVANSLAESIPAAKFNNWYCPPEGGLLVSVAEGPTTSDADDEWTIVMDNYRRWSGFQYS